MSVGERAGTNALSGTRSRRIETLGQDDVILYNLVLIIIRILM